VIIDARSAAACINSLSLRGLCPRPTGASALRFASRASVDSVQSLDSVHSVTEWGPTPAAHSGAGPNSETFL
jgi:hypothetical protein